MIIKRLFALSILVTVFVFGCNKNEEERTEPAAKKPHQTIVDDSEDQAGGERERDKTFGTSNDATDARQATEDSEQQNKEAMDQSE